jgi:hypothetical protein
VPQQVPDGKQSCRESQRLWGNIHDRLAMVIDGAGDGMLMMGTVETKS